MDDVRLGSTIRTARVRRGWRQEDLARLARTSRASISRIERGHPGSLPLDLLRRVCMALEISLDLVPRWRGGELDRMLGLRHSQMHESVARALVADFGEWLLAPEVSFSIFGERGVIDLLLWHPGRRALLVIELKTDLTDINEMLGTMDRKRRLAWQVATERGWAPATVSAWIVVAGSRTNERRIAEHRTMLRAGYAADGRSVRSRACRCGQSRHPAGVPWDRRVGFVSAAAPRQCPRHEAIGRDADFCRGACPPSVGVGSLGSVVVP
jgi:transcriptional regulator with XRE-family HTH domain